MREIKFRAWENGQMLHMPIDGNYGVSRFFLFLSGFAIVEQFTGLKDKHGKDIYEGDILSCNEYESSDCGRKIIQHFNNAVVGFYSGNYYYYPKGNMNQPHQLLMYAYDAQIIGNIHQNPDLLL